MMKENLNVPILFVLISHFIVTKMMIVVTRVMNRTHVVSSRPICSKLRMSLVNIVPSQHST